MGNQEPESYTVSLVFVPKQDLTSIKTFKKKSHRHLHTEKKGKQQGELYQSNRVPESFQSEVIGFLFWQ